MAILQYTGSEAYSSEDWSVKYRSEEPPPQKKKKNRRTMGLELTLSLSLSL